MTVWNVGDKHHQECKVGTQFFDSQRTCLLEYAESFRLFESNAYTTHFRIAKTNPLTQEFVCKDIALRILLTDIFIQIKEKVCGAVTGSIQVMTYDPMSRSSPQTYYPRGMHRGCEAVRKQESCRFEEEYGCCSARSTQGPPNSIQEDSP